MYVGLSIICLDEHVVFFKTGSMNNNTTPGQIISINKYNKYIIYLTINIV